MLFKVTLCFQYLLKHHGRQFEYHSVGTSNDAMITQPTQPLPLELRPPASSRGILDETKWDSTEARNMFASREDDVSTHMSYK
jgi:hypothetical protein